jgi:hypothetical protein
MNLPDFGQLIDNKLLLSALSAVAGGFIGNLVAVLRGRVKTLEYTVAHDRIALSADDAIFGSIQVIWQSHNVTNLFTSRVELANQTGSDLTDLKIKVYTGTTLLLGQRTEIPGTTHILKFTDDFEGQLRIAPGRTPTAEQFNLYNHSREYLVPVLNRGQRVVLTYLTTVPSGTEGPSVWLDTLHKGVRVRYQPLVPQVHGVPIKIAVAVGLAAAIATLALASIFLTEPWAAATVCLLVGLIAQSIGAWLYRAYLFVKSLIIR